MPDPKPDDPPKDDPPEHDPPNADPPKDDPPEDDPPKDPEPADVAAEKWKALARKHEKESKARAKKIEELETASKSDAEKAVDEARTEGSKEARDRYAGKLFAAELRAIAKGKLNVPGTLLADPDVGRKLLDLDDFPVDDDGEVDTDAITAAVDALLVKDPTLAPTDGKKPPKVPAGPRGETPKDLEDLSVDDFRELLHPKK